ncbi:MAG TPA: hypothetical protein V6D08_01150 [Candidatus Obscuribacterales bacterium]
MDREYISRTIETIEREKAAHDEKFAGNPHHENCLPRFDQAIAKLKKELEKLQDYKATTTQNG